MDYCKIIFVQFFELEEVEDELTFKNVISIVWPLLIGLLFIFVSFYMLASGPR